MSILDNFNNDVIEINISNKNINESLDFSKFTKLQTLDCSYNKIIQLNNLPNSLQTLYCINNQIVALDNLPNSLQT